MITVRQMERLCSSKAYDRLLEQLMQPRPEGSKQLLEQLTGVLPAAAMVVIRLDELSQSFSSLYGELVRTLIRAQKSDGGWGDVMTTTICLRALLCGNGNGQAVDSGLAFLTALQKPQGIWPGVSNRRMPEDPFASAFMLLRLGDMPQFCQSVDLQSAYDWFTSNELALDEQTRRIWAHARRRLYAGNRAPRAAATKVPSAPASFWDFTAALGAR